MITILQVVLREGQSPLEGEEIAQKLMRDLNITSDTLITCAYMDLLLEREKVWVDLKSSYDFFCETFLLWKFFQTWLATHHKVRNLINYDHWQTDITVAS